jgi:hypothetical protein
MLIEGIPLFVLQGMLFKQMGRLAKIIQSIYPALAEVGPSLAGETKRLLQPVICLQQSIERL